MRKCSYFDTFGGSALSIQTRLTLTQNYFVDYIYVFARDFLFLVVNVWIEDNLASRRMQRFDNTH